MPTLMHLGMVVVGLPYTFQGRMGLNEILGSSPYGTATISGADGSRKPSPIELEAARSQGGHAFGGVVSLAFGALMIFAPLAGAVALTWWLGAYSLVSGIVVIVLAFRSRSQRGRRSAVGATQPAR